LMGGNGIDYRLMSGSTGSRWEFLEHAKVVTSEGYLLCC
jgi:hypothetical protein